MAISPLYATLTPTPLVIPISNASGLLDDWVTPALSNPMTTDQDIIVGGVGGTPGRLGVGPLGYVLTVGSGGVVDWEPGTGGFLNPMTTSQDLIVGGLGGAPARLGVGTVGQVLTVGSGGIVDWETPAAAGGTVTHTGGLTSSALVVGNGTADIKVLASLGTTSTVLHGNAAGLPTWGGVVLTTDVSGVLPVANGGTALSSYTTGDLIQASGSGTLATLAAVATGNVLISGGVGTVSSWGKVGLATHVSGNLPVTNLNSGTSASATTFWRGDGTWATPAGGGSGTVNSGTANQVAYYPATAAAVSGSSALTIDATTTAVGIQPTARSSGVVPYLTVTAPADTALTAGTEAIGVSFTGATRQHASNTAVTSQREIVFAAPTYSFASATGTITNAATVAITNSPVVGTNAAITNRLALWIQSGPIGFGSSGSIAKIDQASGGFTHTASGSNQGFAFIASGNGALTLGSASSTVPTQGVMGVYGNSDLTAGMFIRRGSADAFSGGLTLTKARGSIASPSAISNNDDLGNIYFGGYDGAWRENRARVQAQASQAWSSGNNGSRLIFLTTLNGTGAINSTLNLTLENDLTATFGGSIKTSTPSGGTAAFWKLGSLVTAAVVPDTTRYIQLDVGGTLFKLIVST